MCWVGLGFIKGIKVTLAYGQILILILIARIQNS